MEKERPVLSISMLVSNNRRDTIEKCMESLVPLIEAVSSELIIVDTGCTDGSVDIARKYADKVVRFTWCKDFSAARNAGLAECTGEWFLYLDDDEWFEDVSELIDFFNGEDKEVYDGVWYSVRNYHNFEGASYTDTYVGRVVRRCPETKFFGRVHEWIEPVPKNVKRVRDYVHHYGYVFENEEERKKHAHRNISLVEAVIKEEPDNIRMCCQLVQEYRLAKRYEDAVNICKATLEKVRELRDNPFVQYLLLALPRIYREQGDFERALDEMKCLEESACLSRQAKLVLYHEKAAVYVLLRQEDELQQECKRYLEEYAKLVEEGENAENLIMDFAAFSSPYVRQVVATYGVESVLRSKNYTWANVFFDAIEWKKDQYEMIIALIQCYVDSGDVRLLQRYIPRILEVDELKGFVYGTFDSMYERYPEKRKRIANDLEFFSLAEQLKSKVRACLNANKGSEAKLIVKELETMMPDDDEIKVWVKLLS